MEIPQSVNLALLIVSATISFMVISPLTGFLAARNADGWVKSLIASILALSEAVAAVLLAKQWDATNLAATILVVMLAAGFAYKTILGELSRKAQDVGLQIGGK